MNNLNYYSYYVDLQLKIPVAVLYHNRRIHGLGCVACSGLKFDSYVRP